jgi:hypothetical protein
VPQLLGGEAYKKPPDAILLEGATATRRRISGALGGNYNGFNNVAMIMMAVARATTLITNLCAEPDMLPTYIDRTTASLRTTPPADRGARSIPKTLL